MQYRTLTACLLAALVCGAPLHADTLKLKQGKTIAGKSELEGRVISQSGNIITFEYKANASGSIKETVRISKFDVADIVREDVSAKDFKTIEALWPTPDLLEAADYTPRIRQIEDFITKHKDSDLTKDAKAIIAKLSGEQQAVEAGGLKMGGKVIPAAEVKADAYQFDVSLLANKVSSALKRRANLEALKAFSELDEVFPNSPERRELAADMLKVMRTLRAYVAPLIDSYDERMEKRENQIEQLPAADAAIIRADWDQSIEQLETRYQTEKNASQRWVTPNENHLSSLQDMLSQLESEISRLTQPAQPASGPDPAKAYRKAWQAIQDKLEPEELEKAINDVRSAALPDKYIALLKEAATANGVENTGL